MFVGYVDDDVTVTVPTKPTGHLQGPKQEIDETAQKWTGASPGQPPSTVAEIPAQPQAHGEPCVGTRTQWAPVTPCLPPIYATVHLGHSNSGFREGQDAPHVYWTHLFPKYHVLGPPGVWEWRLLQYSEGHVVVTLHYQQEIGLRVRLVETAQAYCLAQRAGGTGGYVPAWEGALRHTVP